MIDREPTLEQRRASFALARIRLNQEARLGNYVSYVSALPATIVMNGLGQALATLLAKDRGDGGDRAHAGDHRRLYRDVAAWLSDQISELRVTGDHLDEVLRKLIEADQDVYVRAQAESIAYLNWLKQFARAYLDDTEQQDG